MASVHAVPLDTRITISMDTHGHQMYTGQSWTLTERFGYTSGSVQFSR